MIDDLVGRLTLDGDTKYRVANSGKMNRLTSQPHVNRVKERSCHKATNEKIRTVLQIEFFVPPRGM